MTAGRRDTLHCHRVLLKRRPRFGQQCTQVCVCKLPSLNASFQKKNSPREEQRLLGAQEGYQSQSRTAHLVWAVAEQYVWTLCGTPAALALALGGCVDKMEV